MLNEKDIGARIRATGADRLFDRVSKLDLGIRTLDLKHPRHRALPL